MLTSGYAPPPPKSAFVLGFHPLRFPYAGSAALAGTGSGASSTCSTGVWIGTGRALGLVCCAPPVLTVRGLPWCCDE